MTYNYIETLPDEHRLFTRSGYGGILIADNSGQTPDQTDDGDLWLDQTRPLSIEQIGWGKTYCSIPLKTLDGETTRTTTNAATILRLAVLLDWQIRVAAPNSHVTYEAKATVA